MVEVFKFNSDVKECKGVLQISFDISVFQVYTPYSSPQTPVRGY